MAAMTAICTGLGCIAGGDQGCCAQSAWFDQQTNTLYTHNFDRGAVLQLAQLLECATTGRCTPATCRERGPGFAADLGHGKPGVRDVGDVLGLQPGVGGGSLRRPAAVRSQGPDGQRGGDDDVGNDADDEDDVVVRERPQQLSNTEDPGED
jgi:hypothetical protein